MYGVSWGGVAYNEHKVGNLVGTFASMDEGLAMSLRGWFQWMSHKMHQNFVMESGKPTGIYIGII